MLPFYNMLENTKRFLVEKSYPLSGGSILLSNLALKIATSTVSHAQDLGRQMVAAAAEVWAVNSAQKLLLGSGKCHNTSVGIDAATQLFTVWADG